MFGGWPPYVPVAERRKQAARHAEKLKKKGRTLASVQIEGRTIAHSYWGKAWCDNLESYSDYENRMPRGRTYVRNGSVVDLQITAGRITALVSGSEMYEIAIDITPLSAKRWQALVSECSGQVGSLVELLRGKLARAVMDVLARPHTGLFPAPSEIELSCSCPDWATMCKHVAAALYGVGARLDTSPSLFFMLRQVDERELVAEATNARVIERHPESALATDELEGIFGIELDAPPAQLRAPSAGRAPAGGKSEQVLGSADRPRASTRSRKPAKAARKPAKAARKQVLCYHPSCKNLAAPRHGMFCAALHKGLSRAKKERFRKLRREAALSGRR